MNTNKYLPIGTIVLLKDATKRVMITGFVITPDEDKTKVFDYSGCLYPEGVISSQQTLLFNHDQIERIFHLGFYDEEEKEFKNKLIEYLNNNKK